jgi:hypothetical protein
MKQNEKQIEKILHDVRIDLADMAIIMNTVQKRMCERIDDLHRLELMLSENCTPKKDLEIFGGMEVFNPQTYEGGEE